MLKAILNKFLPKTPIKAKEAITHVAHTQKIYLFESNQKDIEDIINSPTLTGIAPGYVYFVQEYMN